MKSKSKNIFQVYLEWLPYIILGLGVVLRIAVYIQNRSLEVDEANVARNIYERGFIGLLSPLNYQQFAPPGYLWMTKLCALIAGYGEQALRFFPLLCSLVSLWLFFQVLKQFVSNKVSWYALLLFATGYLYIYYATEVKQYSSDTAIALGLLFLALKTEAPSAGAGKFLLKWVGVGLIAIWFSMPSVFVLAGISTYYFYGAYKEKSGFKMKLSAGISIIWLLIFALFYFLFLQKGIQSEDLKMYHAQHFMPLLPATPEARALAFALIAEMFSNAGGGEKAVVIFHIILFLTGVIVLIRKQKARAFLVLIPILALFIASGLQQFTLLPRVIMFIMPVLLLVISVGFAAAFNMPNPAPKIILVLAGILSLGTSHQLKYLFEPLYYEEIKEALREVKNNNIPPERFHINVLLQPALAYYTTIHPGQDEYAGFDSSYILPWQDNYDTVAMGFTQDAVLYGWYPQDRMYNEFQAYNKYCIMKQIEVPGMHLYICTSKRLYNER